MKILFSPKSYVSFEQRLMEPRDEYFLLLIGLTNTHRDTS